MVAQQAWLAAELGRRYGSHPAIVGWLVSNEMPLYGLEAPSADVTAWARIIVQAVRSSGARQPVSLGDGAWGIEVTGHDNGYSLRELAPLVDFIGPHSYPMESDQVRQMLTSAFITELCGGFGKPVVLEEFGVTSDFVSDQNAVDYYTQVLYTTLLAGATGWLAWNNCDYDDIVDQDPYRHHLFELHFGLTDRNGKPKPQLGTLAEFSRFVESLAADGWEPIKGEVALVVPEHFERALPFTTEDYRRDVRDNLLQSYVAAREADLPVQIMREVDGFGGALLYLVPGAKLLTGPGLRKLQQLATEGATVYLSYFAGSTTNQRGPWITWLDEIFGVRHSLRYGLIDPIEDDEVTFHFVEDFGDIPTGTTLSFRVGGNENARCYLPVEAVGATVVAVDGHGRPALLRHALGAGETVLCTYPLEYMAARLPSANPEETWRIYSALASLAGVARPVRVDDPRVLVGRLRTGATGQVVFLNCSADPVVADVLVEGDFDLQLAAGELRLAPFGVEVAAVGGALASAPAVDEGQPS
jgi:endo-1,4-beta-mannosidase